MSDFLSSTQRMLARLDPPGLKAFKEVHEKLNSLRPAAIDDYLEPTKVIRNLTLSPEFKNVVEWQQKISEMNLKGPLANFIDTQKLMQSWVKTSPTSHFLETQATLLKITGDFTKTVQLLKYYSQIQKKDINYNRQIGSFYTPSELVRILGQFSQDLTIEEGDELEVDDYNLIQESTIEVPENKILLLNEVTHIEKTIESIYKDNSHLYQIHHREFEEMIAELLRSRDFEVFLTKKTRDGGTDIIALQNLAGLPLKLLIECKRNSPNRKIGVEIIRSFSHVVNTKQANKGIIFTTSYFTADARKEQQQHMPYLLDLRDYNDVIAWVNNYIQC